MNNAHRLDPRSRPDGPRQAAQPFPYLHSASPGEDLLISTFRILSLPGDGVGPEVIALTETTLESHGAHYGHRFVWTREFVDAAVQADAILFGAVGDPRLDGSRSVRLEQAIDKALRSAPRTADLGGTASTTLFAEHVQRALKPAAHAA